MKLRHGDGSYFVRYELMSVEFWCFQMDRRQHEGTNHRRFGRLFKMYPEACHFRSEMNRNNLLRYMPAHCKDL